MHYEDLIEVDLIRKDYIGSTMYSKYRPGYKWYYLDEQRPDEVCFFKNFDSNAEVKASSESLTFFLTLKKVRSGILYS